MKPKRDALRPIFGGTLNMGSIPFGATHTRRNALFIRMLRRFYLTLCRAVCRLVRFSLKYFTMEYKYICTSGGVWLGTIYAKSDTEFQNAIFVGNVGFFLPMVFRVYTDNPFTTYAPISELARPQDKHV